jgi:surface carbohydrate biosynthesis protein
VKLNKTKATLLMPVENQVRELDSKLLLACIGVRRGFSSIIGPRREMHIQITAFPRSIYLAKSIPVHRNIIFKIMRKLGHKIVAWDEEALVHPQAETYYRKRLCPLGIRYASHLFAWGEDNALLWEQYPDLPAGMPIHLTGNPRGDLLRSEMRGIYEEDVKDLLSVYGDFILINTNFNHVNAFSPELNLFRPDSKPGELPKFGRAAKGMSREYAEGLRDHKQAIFLNFQQLIPALEEAFPKYTIVVRPHPTENQQIYKDIAARCNRVRVTNEGNVVPWILASQAVIHNGCTTGVEAYVLGVAAVSYRATVNDYYDLGFYRLPNLLSYQCFDFDELRGTLEDILAGKLGPADGEERGTLVNQYLEALEGPFACERMVDVLEKIVQDGDEFLRPPVRDRLAGWSLSAIRTLIKRRKERIPGSHNRPEFQRHRYPGISLEQIRARLSRFQQVLGDSRELQVKLTANQFFQISS